jgi:hypothetical protein
MSAYRIGSQMMHFFAFGFLPALFVALFLLRKSRRTENPRQKQGYTAAFITLVILLIALANIGGYMSQWGANAYFDQSLQTCTQASFQKASAAPVIVIGAPLAEFKQWIGGPVVKAHHSHPVSPIYFSLGTDPSVYAIAPDSSGRDEFWVSVFKNPWGSRGPTIRQIHSAELGVWLQQQNL